MSHDALIPPNVDADDAELLRRAYALRGREDGEQLYSEWAATYNRTMIDGLGYQVPRLTAEVFTRNVPWRDRLVLDIGCGTGLVGAELAQRGFSALEGLDLSAEMMHQAEGLGIYSRFTAADLNAPLPIADATYGGAVCAGTFTSGHVGASCLDEIVRIIAPRGYFGCSVHNSVWDDLGFADRFARLERDGALRHVEILESPYYTTSTAPDGRFCLFQRTA